MNFKMRLFWTFIIVVLTLLLLFVFLLVKSEPLGKHEILFATLFLEAIKVGDVVSVEVGIGDKFIRNFIIISTISFCLTFIVDLGKVVRK